LFELDASNALDYLSSVRGMDGALLRVTALGGGVSNTVLLVEGGGDRFVLKQALGKLRVEHEWLSDRERIFRESAALRALAPHVGDGALPEVLFEDRANCLFAMTAAPASAESWKDLLMRGQCVPDTAARIGRMLAAVIRSSLADREMGEAFGDQAVFDQLRLDPYYRTTANRHPELRPYFDGLIEDYVGRRISLVHGDWSPKNFLVDGESVMAIDFEVIHFGDPAFDAAFMLNHLLLKSFHMPAAAPELAGLADTFWEALTEDLPLDASALEARALHHLGGLLLARIDGKSPAEYIREESARERIRRFAQELIRERPRTVREVFGAVGR
jgi:5-methylthioribose kinase